MFYNCEPLGGLNTSLHEIDSSITGSLTPGGIGKTPLSVTPNNMIDLNSMKADNGSKFQRLGFARNHS